MTTYPTTTIRLTDDDRAVLAKLQALTGLQDMAAIIRLAIREALAARKPRRSK